MVPQPSTVRPAEVTATFEREYRFVPAAALPREAVVEPHWRGYRVSTLPDEHQVNTYLDTPDQALARRGVSFRRRVLGPRAELTLKLPRADRTTPLFARPEYSEPIGIDEPLAGHRLLTMAEEFAGGRPIGPWFTFRTWRRGALLRDEAAAIVLTWDHLSLPDDPTFTDEEIEAELLDGDEASLDALAALLVRDHGLRFGDAGKRTRVGRYLARRGRIAFPGVERPMPLAELVAGG